MERESGGLEPKSQNESKGKLQTALRVMGMFLYGLSITAFTGSVLASMRMPHSNWRQVPLLVLLITMIPNLLRKDDTKVRVVSSCLLLPLVIICYVGLFFLRAHDWMPIASGVLFAVFFGVLSKSDKRPYWFLAAGSLLGGVLSLQFPWPNEQRCLLPLLGVGLAAILQGIWIIIRYPQGYWPIEPEEQAKWPDESFERRLLRVIHWILGTVENVQVTSPELEQRIRIRYEAEISQLTDLGFDYCFSDGQTISLFRFALLLPAIAVIGVWLKRRPMSLHDGTKLLIAYPIFFSHNKAVYAEISDFGVNFNTAFTDGTILISNSYKDDTASGPKIVKYSQKASISNTWNEHQKRIAELEREGKRVELQSTFQFYVEISSRETAAW